MRGAGGGNGGGREGGEKLCLLFYSCLEDMAHTRPPNPIGNGKPRGKGKTNKGSGTGVGGCVFVCVRAQGLDEENGRGRRGRREFRVCVSGGVWRFSCFCFRGADTNRGMKYVLTREHQGPSVISRTASQPQSG